MSLTPFVIMPGKDYQSICDAFRRITGGSEPLKSGDLVGLCAETVELDAELLNAGGAHPAIAPFAKIAIIPEGATYLDLDTFRNMPGINTVCLYGKCELEQYQEYNSSSKSYTYFNALAKGGITLKKLTIGGAWETIAAQLGAGLTELEELVFEDGVITIENYAFSDCTSLKTVTIPASVTSAKSGGGNALPWSSECPALTIRGYAGTYAEEYANVMGYNFEVIDE